MTFGISVGSKKRERDLKRNNAYNKGDVKSSPINLMEKDKVMVRMIKDGKGSDKGIKREAEIIEREHEDRRKMAMREKDQRELAQLKDEHRRSLRGY